MQTWGPQGWKPRNKATRDFQGTESCFTVAKALAFFCFLDGEARAIGSSKLTRVTGPIMHRTLTFKLTTQCSFHYITHLPDPTEPPWDKDPHTHKTTTAAWVSSTERTGDRRDTNRHLLPMRGSLNPRPGQGLHKILSWTIPCYYNPLSSFLC